ncbi:hypothetical protein BsWGS_19999 [Bradybaena similaris]
MLKDTVCRLKADTQLAQSLISVDHRFVDKSSALILACDDGKDRQAKTNISTELQICKPADIIGTFPDNLRRIPELKYHHWLSELSQCKTPSVRRAVSHLELIQNAIEDCFLKMSVESQSGQASQNSLATGRKHFKIETSLEKVGSDDHSSHSPHAVSTPRNSSLTTITRPSRTSPTMARELSDAEDGVHVVADLGALEVIAEVILLISELETDRRETQEMYLKEMRRAEWLRRQIDELRLRHLRELPSLVQREHEACIMDLTELQWHVTYSRRLQGKAQARFSVSHRSNTQLRERIDFVKQHVPLVQEKLVLEVDAMDNIRKAQGHRQCNTSCRRGIKQADQELVVAQQKQAKVHMRSQETANKASTERGHIRRELDRGRDDVKTIRDHLNEAVMTHKAYVHQINDIYKKMAENDREMEVITVKNENAKTSEAMQATKVRNLQVKATEAEFDFRCLDNEIQKQEQEREVKKEQYVQVEVQLEQKKKAAEKQLQMASRENLAQSLEVQELEDKAAKLEHQKAADAKNVARMNQEIERTTILLQQTDDQHSQILNTNDHLQNQLQLQKDKAFRMEEKLKKSAEGLRRQTQEEIHTKKVLQARIGADQSELDKVKLETASKKDKAQSITAELEKAVSSVLEKVNKLQAIRLEKQQLTQDLTSQIQETEQRHIESFQMFSQTLTQVEPQHHSVQTDLNSVNKQLQTMEADISTMRNKIEEMDSAQIMMERFVTKAQNEIQILTSELQELELQLEAERKIGDDLRKQLHETLERLQGQESQHKRLHSDRQEVLHKHERDKTLLMENNQQLAARYRQLQKDYLLRKERMLKSYDERVKCEASITDMKQLKSLQLKLHGALVEFFKVSSLYGRTALSKLEQESWQNAGRVSQLHVNMQRALEDISQFLNARKEGTLAKMSTLGSVRRGPESLPPVLFEDKLKPTETTFRVEVEQS